MDATTQTTKIINLVLTEDEATWLKNYMQNPFVPSDEEDPDEMRMREKFFTCLHQTLR